MIPTIQPGRIIQAIPTPGGMLTEATPEQAAAAGASPAEIASALAALDWRDLRQERNRRLADTDWTQVADAPLTPAQKAAWKAYRDALRALPDSLKAAGTDPATALADPAHWPVKPSN